MIIGGGPALRDANHSGVASPKSKGKSVIKKHPQKRPSTSTSNSQLSNSPKKSILPLSMKKNENIPKRRGN